MAPALAWAPDDDDWARDTLETFAARGLLDRTRERTFLGTGSASRWEIARDVARLLGDVRRSQGQWVTSEELKKLERLVSNFSSELSQMGIDATVTTAPPAFRAGGLGGLRLAPAGLSLPELALDTEIQRLRSEFLQEPSLRLKTGFLQTDTLTDFPGNLGALSLDTTHLELGWELDSRWALRGGLDLAFERSLAYPSLTLPDSSFDEITSSVAAPYLGIDRKLTESTAINLDIRYFSAREDFRLRSLEPAELPSYPGVSSDSWEVNTRFIVRF